MRYDAAAQDREERQGGLGDAERDDVRPQQHGQVGTHELSDLHAGQHVLVDEAGHERDGLVGIAALRIVTDVLVQETGKSNVKIVNIYT